MKEKKINVTKDTNKESSGEIMKHETENKEKCPVCELRPVVDVSECQDGITLAFEVPGAAAKDVCVEVKSGVLSIRAESSLCRRERQVVYARAFQLSDAVDVENICAKTKDGVLTIFLPKSEKAKVHRIKVS